MFSINILLFMYNFSFKGDTLYRLIPSRGIDLFIPRIVLWKDTISRDTGLIWRCIWFYLSGYLFRRGGNRKSENNSVVKSSLICLRRLLLVHSHDDKCRSPFMFFYIALDLRDILCNLGTVHNRAAGCMPSYRIWLMGRRVLDNTLAWS